MKLYNISFNNLRRRKTRFLFLVAGLVIAVGTVVTMIAVSRAMNADIANKLDEFGANIVIVPKSDDLSLTYGGMTVSGVFTEGRKLSTENIAELLRIKNKDNIKIIAPKLLNFAAVARTNVLVVGVDFPQELQLKKWWRLHGSAPTIPTEALIGADVQAKLGLDIGGRLAVNGKTFAVTGFLEPTGSQDDGLIFIDLKEAQRLFKKPDELSLIEVAALCYDCPIEEIVRQTSERLPDAKVTAIRQTIESKMEAMHRFERFSLGISLVVILVAALIVMTNMIASVNERTREIGVFRAIGFRQAHIMSIILTEAFLTSTLAGLIGYGVGALATNMITPILAMGSNSRGGPSYELFGIALGLSVVVGMTSSIYPAYKASRLDPTIALKAL